MPGWLLIQHYSELAQVPLAAAGAAQEAAAEQAAAAAQAPARAAVAAAVAPAPAAAVGSAAGGLCTARALVRLIERHSQGLHAMCAPETGRHAEEAVRDVCQRVVMR